MREHSSIAVENKEQGSMINSTCKSSEKFSFNENFSFLLHVELMLPLRERE